MVCAKFQAVGLLLVLASFDAVFGLDMTLTAPSIDDQFSDSFEINFAMTKSVSYTGIDIYLMKERSFSIVATIKKNHPITETTLSFSPPSNVYGDFWIATVQAGKFGIKGYGPSPNGGSWGAKTFTIVEHFCYETALPHESCGAGSYCDDSGACYVCKSCLENQDSYNDFCPAKCGGKSTYDVGDTIPDVTEATASGSVRDVVKAGCSRHNSLVELTNEHVIFESSNLMTKRLHDKLLVLVAAMQANEELNQFKLVVESAYEVAADDLTQVTLHHEGRAARISLDGEPTPSQILLFFLKAKLANFDWLHFLSDEAFHVSVVQDLCTAPVDLMYLLDGSGSIEMTSYGGKPDTFKDKVLGFVNQTVGYFNIGEGIQESRFGVAVFSEDATIEIPLDNGYSSDELREAIYKIKYPSSKTYTTKGLNLVRTDLMPDLRPLTDGVSRVLIVMTDGLSGDGDPTDASLAVQDENVNVFAMGVGSALSLDQLEGIASSKSNVYILKSFDRILDVVAAISSKACDAPAVLTAGEQTDTSVGNCEIKYFSPSCGVVEGADLRITIAEITGSVEVYISSTSSHPGPFDYEVKDTTDDTEKILFIRLQEGQTSANIIIAVKGTSDGNNEFTLDAWSDIFQGISSSTHTVSEATATGTLVYSPPVSKDSTSSRKYLIEKGNTNSDFAIDQVTGQITISRALDYERTQSYNLRVQGNTEGQPCLNGFTDVLIKVGNENDNNPEINGGRDREGNFIAFPFSVSLAEDTPINTLVWTINASDPDDVATGSLKYSLLMKRRGRAVRQLVPVFRINQAGAIYTNAKLDYETQDSYTMEVSVSDEGNPPRTASSSATIVIAPVYCPEGTASDTGTFPCAVERECYPTEFEERASTSETKRLCTPLTAPCTVGDTYETTQATLTSDRVCTPQVACEADEYESVASTYSSLRVCTPGTTCEAGEFESVPLTTTADRECTEYTVCDGITKYVWKAGGDDFDVVCRTATVCVVDAEFESKSPSTFSNRECDPLTVCASDGTEYESTAPDVATDRGCSPVSPVCDYDTHFEASAPTNFSDRVCSELLECTPATHYETTQPTSTSNRVCTGLRVCTSAEFESRAPEPLTRPLSNRECTTTRICTQDEFITVNATSTSDRDCQEHTPRCEVGATYQTVAPSLFVDRVCTAVSECDVMSTEFVARPATEFSDLDCVTASVCTPTIEYETVALTRDNDRQCVVMTVCSEDPKQHETVAPTPTSNRVCQQTGFCTTDEYETVAPTSTTDRECDTLDVCDLTFQFESLSASLISNRECTSLTVCSVTLSNTYRTTLATPTSNRECASVKSCDDDEYETDEPTDVSNRVCEAITDCLPSEFQTVAPTDVTNRECDALLTCSVGEEFEQVAPTATSQRICQSFTGCEGHQFESVAGTATSDRSCTDARVCSKTEFETTAPTATTDRDCETLRTCENSQHETSPPDASTNRFCANNRACKDNQYQTQAPGKSTDRECTNHTVCAEVGLEYEFSKPTRFDNRECRAVDACDDKYYEKTKATATSNTVCLPWTVCAATEYESRAPTYFGNRECTPYTICLLNQFESVEPTSTSDLQCTDVTACVIDETYEVLDATDTTDRQCESVKQCEVTTEFQSEAPTLFADRDCTPLTTCAELQFQSKEPTATSNRECTDLTQCSPDQYLAQAGTPLSNAVCEVVTGCAAVGDEYLVAPANVTHNTVCAAVTICDYSVQFQAIAPTATSDATCTVITSCEDPLVEDQAPTPTSDRTCQTACDSELNADGTCPEAVLITQNSTAAATGKVSTMVIAGVLVAILMIILLVVAIYKMPRRKKNQKDAVEARSLIEGDDDFNPMFVTQHNPSSAIAMMATLSSPAALTKRGDRLWTEFRRCIAFDEMYFGNQPLLLKDAALEDIYALLAVTCPPRSFFDNLREVGTRFMIQEIDTADPDSVVLDDVVDYFARAMPDVIIERAIDMLAVLAISGSDFPEDEINETFYAMIDDYVPDENHYLCPSIDGRRMGEYAATRELHQVDPIYYEVDDEKESDYELVSEYAIGGSMNIEREPVYHMSGLDDEEEDNGYSDFTKPGEEDTYSFANSSTGMESNDMDDDIYSMANSSLGVDDARGNNNDTYSLANSITIGMGGDNDTYSTADSGPENFLYGYNERYTTASSSPNETEDSQAVYDVGDSTVEAAAIANRALNQGGSEQLYDTADPQDYRSSGADETIYDTANSGNADVDYRDRAPQKYNAYGQATDSNPDLVYDTATLRDENGIAAGDVGYKDRAPQRYNAYGQAIGLDDRAIYDTGNSANAPECAIYDTGNSAVAPGECAIYDTGNSAVAPSNCAVYDTGNSAVNLTYDTANSAVERVPTLRQPGGHQVYDVGDNDEPLYATADTAEEHGNGTRRNSTQRTNHGALRVNAAYDLDQRKNGQIYDVPDSKAQIYDVPDTKAQIYDVPDTSPQVYDMGDAVCSQEDAIYDNNNMENSMPAEIEDDIYDNVTTSKTGTIMKDAPGKVVIDMFPDENDDESSTLLTVGRNDTMKSITSADIHAMESDFMAMEEDGFRFDPDTMERRPAGNMDTLKSNSSDSPYMAVGGYLKVEGEPTQL
eukprot:m.58856 g.58856  ORF g.58856 m.58856 type:complete len:2591 (+) comp22623_c0_seq1:340-8112(+)